MVLKELQFLGVIHQDRESDGRWKEYTQVTEDLPCFVWLVTYTTQNGWVVYTVENKGNDDKAKRYEYNVCQQKDLLHLSLSPLVNIFVVISYRCTEIFILCIKCNFTNWSTSLSNDDIKCHKPFLNLNRNSHNKNHFFQILSFVNDVINQPSCGSRWTKLKHLKWEGVAINYVLSWSTSVTTPFLSFISTFIKMKSFVAAHLEQVNQKW